MTKQPPLSDEELHNAIYDRFHYESALTENHLRKVNDCANCKRKISHNGIDWWWCRKLHVVTRPGWICDRHKIKGTDPSQ